jgi:3',5'-cyclic-AMP phosphodiesterase
VFLATQVLPFVEACFYEGRPSDPEWLAYFANVDLRGEMILEVAGNFPERKIKVYAGHNQHAARYETANVQCFVGGAKYGYLKLNRLSR